MPVTRADEGSEYTENGTGRRQPREPAVPPATVPGSAARPKGKRGPSRTSCAECRRLKLKCDGKVPCNQCVKRGYTALCPDGTQTTGQGHRLFWNTTSELRVKLSEFTERIRQLEDGLRAAHSLISHERHPLLSDELLQIKEGGGAPARSSTQAHVPLAAETEEQKPDVEVLDRFGSLAISQSGGSKHFGHGANSWWFMHNEEDASEDGQPTTVSLNDLLPTEILAQTGSFPLALISPPYDQAPDDHLRMLLDFIPSEGDAIQLRDDAFKYAFFMFRPIPIEQYSSNVHHQIYEDGPLSPNDILTAPRLAVFFTLLAVGALVTPSLAPHSPQAERFHQLGRAALMRSRLVEEPTIEGIQALFLMSLYMSLHDTAAGNTSNVRWSMAGLVMKLTQTMGLQCEPDRFGLSAEESKRRRMLFGELFVYDMGQAVMFGRPPAIGGSYYDVRPYTDESTTPETDFHTWKYKFASECLGPVHLEAYSATPPSYSTVINLTQRVESYPVWDPASEGLGRDRPDYADRLMQRHFSRVTKQEVLLYLHRPFFARATSEHKVNPLQSEYGSSVIAAYRSAHQIISFVQYLYTQVEHPVDRVWFLWANVFGSAVVLGALVLRCPQIDFARDALNQLQTACDLFARVYVGFSAEKVYDKMIMARDKAHASLSEYCTGQPHLSLGRAGAVDDVDDVLSHLGAKTRKIARGDSAPTGSSASGSVGTPSQRSSPGRADPVVPLPLSAGSVQGFHPRVLQYLQTLPPTVDVQGFDISQMSQTWATQPSGSYLRHENASHDTVDHGANNYATTSTWPSGAISSSHAQHPGSQHMPPSYPSSYSYNGQVNHGYIGSLPPVMEQAESASSYSNPMHTSYHAGQSSSAYTLHGGGPQAGYPAAVGHMGAHPAPSPSLESSNGAFVSGYHNYGPSCNDPNPEAPLAQAPSRDYRTGPPPGSTEWSQLMLQMYPQ